jgi:hypothetical protein
LDLTALVTTGRPMPGEALDPPTLPDHVGALEALTASVGAVLVVVDVLMAYLSDQRTPTGTRMSARPWRRWPRWPTAPGTPVLLLRHLPRVQRRAGQGLSAGSGSIGIIGMARAGMIAAVDPADPTGQRRVLARAKGNLAPQWSSLAYQLVCSVCGRPACDALDHGPARLEWLGETSISADRLLSERESDDHRSKLDEAADRLRSVLSDGPMLDRDLEPLARAEGVQRTKLHEARPRAELASECDESARGRPATWLLITSGPTSGTSSPGRDRHTS